MRQFFIAFGSNSLWLHLIFFSALSKDGLRGQTVYEVPSFYIGVHKAIGPDWILWNISQGSDIEFVIIQEAEIELS